MTGFRQVFYGRQEPQNHQVLWLRPHGDHKSVDLLCYFNDGWIVVNSHFIINRIRLKKLVKFVTYDDTNSTLSFYDYESKFLFNLPLTNLDNLMKTAFTAVSFDAESQSVTFTNSLGETLYTIDLSDLYTAGNGLSIDGQLISLVIDPDSESYLTVSESGLKLAGIDAIAERVSTSESDIDNLETRMTTAESDIDSLESRMDTAESDIDSLESRMDTAESDIDSLESRMDTAESDIDNLESRMDTAESDIDTAEADIDTLQQETKTLYFTSVEYSERYQSIIFYAANGDTLGTVDTEPFEKDGRLEDVTLEEDPTGYTGIYLHFVFNEDAEANDIYVNLDRLVDTYTGSDSIDISSTKSISLNETYMASLLPDLVKYETDYSSGLTIGHTLVNNTSTDVIVPLASTTQTGVVQIGNGISVTDGEITADIAYVSNYSSGLIVGIVSVGSGDTDIIIPYASASQYGVMKTSNGLSVSNGIVAVKKSSSSEDYFFVDSTGIGVTGIDAIEARLTTAESDIDSLESRMDTAESDIDSLETTSMSKLGSNIYYDSTTKKIYLYASDGTELSSIDATVFIIDGMIDNAEMVTNPNGYDEGTYLHFVFNTDADKADIYINVSDLIDIYTAGDGIIISSNTISVDDDYIASLAETVMTYTGTYSSGLSTGSLSVNDKSYTFVTPYATTSQYGVVKVGSGITVSSGSISITDSYIQSLITGNVSYENSYTSGLTIGVLTVQSADTSVTVPYGSSSQYGVIKTGDGLSTTGGTISIDDSYIQAIVSETADYTGNYTSGLTVGTLTINGDSSSVIIPYGTSTQYGVVKAGSGLTSTSGVLSVTDSYITGLIDEDYLEGIISTSYIQDIIAAYVSFAASYTSGLTIGTATTGSTTVTYRTPYASSSQYGVMKTGDGLTASSGTVSVNDDYLKSVINAEYIEGIIDSDYIAGLISDGTVAGLLNISTSTGTVYIAGVTSTTATTASTLYRPTTQVGGSLIPIYLSSSGALTASSGNAGSGVNPIYMTGGTLTASTSDVGSGKQPVYMSGGALTASGSTVGADTTPTYLNNGVITECSGIPESWITQYITAEYINSLGISTESNLTWTEYD